MINKTQLQEILQTLKTEHWEKALSLLGHHDAKRVINSFGQDGALDLVLKVIPMLIEDGYDAEAMETLDRIMSYRPREAAHYKAMLFLKSGSFRDLTALFTRVKDVVAPKVLQDLISETAKKLLADGKRSEADALLATFGFTLSCQETDMWDAYASAESLAASGKYAESSAILEPLISKADDEALAAIYQMLGENALRAKNFSKAKKIYEDTIKNFESKSGTKEIVIGATMGLAEALDGLGAMQSSCNLMNAVSMDQEAPSWAVSYAQKWLSIKKNQSCIMVQRDSTTEKSVENVVKSVEEDQAGEQEREDF